MRTDRRFVKRRRGNKMHDTRQHPENGFPEAGHDHHTCVEAALEKAAGICEQRQVRLTPLRRRVLEVVWSSHKPIGAYDILDVLAGERGSAAPPTVYRALDFLLKNGMIHRIESLNAFVGCIDPDHPPAERHSGQFLICRTCGSVAEIADPGLERAVVGAAARIGFTVERQTIEVLGTCPICHAVPESADD